MYKQKLENVVKINLYYSTIYIKHFPYNVIVREEKERMHDKFDFLDERCNSVVEHKSSMSESWIPS